VLQRGAMWFSVVQCVAVCCSVLQCVCITCHRFERDWQAQGVAGHCRFLQSVKLQCVAVCTENWTITNEHKVMQGIAVCCIVALSLQVLRDIAVCCSVLQCVAVCAQDLIFTSEHNINYARHTL